MSRGAEYKFIPTDPADVIAWLTERYEQTVGVSVYPASPEANFIRWLADAIVLERVMTNYAANQNIPSRAVGDNLDELSELCYLPERPEAEAASCTMRFTISEAQAFAVLVPAGTRVTDASGALVWATTEDVYVKAGETSTDVKAVCQSTGTAGNGYVAGQINTLVDPFAYYLSCANVTETDGGADRATDDEFYELMRLSMDAYSCAGARGAYIYWAKQVSTQIADVVANSPTAAVVKIYALMEDGTPATEEIKEKILTACSADDVRPLTDYVTAEDPETVAYNIDLTYYLPSDGETSAAELEAAVQAKVDEYAAWQRGKLGRDINPSRLISALMETGIKRVEVREPVYTALEDGRERTVALDEPDANGNTTTVTAYPPQAAKLESVTLINGGYEDE